MEEPEIRYLKKEAVNNHRKKGTAITFTAAEINALARFVAAGNLLLQTNHPVIARIKAALTRLGLPVPKGL